MTEETDQSGNIQADNNSVAVGSVNVGGSIGGDLTIGNTYNYSTSEDDAPISSAELETGLTRFAEYLPERAPVLQEKFASIAKKMRATLGAELSALKRIEEALSKQMALKAEFEATGESDGYVFEEIGECLLTLDRAQEAQPYFAKAYELLSQDAWLAEKESARLARLKELAT